MPLWIGPTNKLRIKGGKLLIGDTCPKCGCPSTGTPVVGCHCGGTSTATDRFQITFSGITVTPPTLGWVKLCGYLDSVNFSYAAPSFGTPGYHNNANRGECCADLSWQQIYAAAYCIPGNYASGNVASIIWSANVGADGSASAGISLTLQGAAYLAFSASRGPTATYHCDSAIVMNNSVSSSPQPGYPGFSGGTVTIAPLSGGSPDCTLPEVISDGGCRSYYPGTTCTDPAP